MIDLAALTGLPYVRRGRSLAGVDCWGLVWLGMRAAGIAVPSYADGYVDDAERDEIAAVIVDGAAAWIPVVDPQPLDVVVFRRGGIDAHTGLVVAPGLMLHVDATAPSRIEPYAGPKWGPRLSAFYRHPSLA